MKKTILVAVAAFALIPFAAHAVPKGCKFYEPGETSVKGLLRHGAVWMVEVDKPFCIEGRENNKSGGIYPTKDEVITVLFSPHRGSPVEEYNGLMGKHVLVTGTLYHKLDNTDAQVMMTVATIKEIKDESPAESPAGAK